MTEELCLGPDLPDLLPPSGAGDPFPHFAALRAGGPIRRVAGGWAVLGYREASAALADPRLGRGGGGGERLAADWLVNLDPPLHGDLRARVAEGVAATPRATLAARIGARIEELLAGLAGRREVEFLADFARPLTGSVVADLLGVPEIDREEVLRLADQLAVAAVGDRTPGAMASARWADGELATYFRDLAGRPEGERFCRGWMAWGKGPAEERMLVQARMLLVAGRETTASFLASALFVLAREPEIVAALGADPGGWRAATEELLRLAGPVLFVTRTAGEALRFAGAEIASGERLFLGIAAANRDPERFAEPDRFVPARFPNPHLAFGGGPHACLGGAIATLEARFALAAWFARFPATCLAAPIPSWRGAPLLRAPSELRLAVS